MYQIERLLKIDELRQQFELAWRAGQQPQLAGYLDAVEPEDRESLFGDLLGVEFELRQDRGDSPTVAEYEEAFPQYAAVIQAVLHETARRTGGRLPLVEPGCVLGDYRIDHEIGRGGMGVVYQAEQRSLGRTVALKVLTPEHQSFDRARARFLREARAAASLHHTHIVPVLEVGEDDGRLYYAMQLIHGRPLQELLAEQRGRPTAEAAAAAPDGGEEQVSRDDRGSYWRRVSRIGRQVAEALQHAHERGILHRDIKPANLLVDRQGNVWVTDFGLAKVDDSDLTHQDEVIGTLRYLAPEALEGRTDARSDVYSLGLTLYELLSLEHPFSAREQGAVLRQVTESRIPALQKTAPNVPRDLAIIIGKATQRDPSDRYQTAQQLADDLDRFLRDEPILARRHTPLDLLQRWVRRNPALAGLMGTLGLVLLGTAVAASLAALHFRRLELRQQRLVQERETQWQRAEDAASAARGAQQQLLRSLAELHHDQSLQYLEQEDHSQALMSAVLALQQLGDTTATDSRSQLSFEESMRYRIAALSDFVPPIIAHRKIDAYDWAQAVARDFGVALAPNPPQLHFLPDGELAVVSLLGNVAFRWQPETDTARPVRIRDRFLPPSELESAKTPADSAAAICFTHDSRHAVQRGTDGQLELWSCEPARLICELESATPERRPLLGCWISPDGRWLLVGLADRVRSANIVVWDAQTGKRAVAPPLQVDDSPPPMYLSVRFGSDHRRAIVVGSKAAVFDLETGTALVPQEDGVSPWASLTNQGGTLAAATGNCLRLRDLQPAADASPIAEIRLPEAAVVLALNCDEAGRWAVAGTSTGDLYIVEMTQKTLARAPIRHGDTAIERIVIHPGATAVAVCDRAGLVRVWGLPSGVPLSPPLRHDRPVTSLVWSQDGARLATATMEGDLRVWDLSRKFSSPKSSGIAHRFALSPDGRRLLGLGGGTGVTVWDLTVHPPRLSQTLNVPDAWTAEWHPDAAHIVTAAIPDTAKAFALQVWDLNKPREAMTTVHEPCDLDRVCHIGLMDGGQMLAFGTPWLDPVLIDLRGATTRLALDRRVFPKSFTRCCAISDRYLASSCRLTRGTEANPLRVWNSAGQLVLDSMLPPGRYVSDLAFSPDGSVLAAVGDFGMRLWGSPDWQPILVDRWDADVPIKHLCFDSSSTWLALVDGSWVCHALPLRRKSAQGNSFQLPGYVRHLRFTPDGKRLAVVTAYRGITLWDWERGEPLTPDYRPDSDLWRCEFSPDGSLLALGHRNGKLEWLTIPAATASSTQDLIRQVGRITGYQWAPHQAVRRLTADQWHELGPPTTAAPLGDRTLEIRTP